MADNLIFRIGFDLEKGVKDAQAQMDNALRRLQKTADGKPLTIPISLDPSKFTTFESALRGSIQHITDDAKSLKAALDSSLQTDNSANINRITEAMRSLEAAWKALPNNQKFDINDRLTPKAQEMIRQFNELATASSTYGQTLSQIAGKIKRVADEEAKANQTRNDGYVKLRKTLGAQENSIANLSAKIKAYQQILNNKEIGSRSFERVAEKIRKLTEQLDKAKAKVAELTGKAQSGASRQAAAVSQVSQEFNKQDSYLTNLLKKTAALWSIHQVGSFLTNIKEVTAQFELQRVSLGAIIQDQNRANQLFSEIKSFALKSPVSILDLTKYTKQLAAYKVGWDGVKTDTKELFDWTKKLTDVSVGLGVSMDRVVLAFGQVRATGYLRASEIRQFTEMGVPIVEELAAKLSKMNGELVTAAQVMDMVSKRGISFEMVKEVFDDMTSAGGIFYNMQEKQGNTLYGMWAKLGDAASVMYDEIGNTESVNKGMKAAIQALTDLMRNWRDTARYISYAGITIAGVVIRNKILKVEMTKVVAIQQAYNTRIMQANALMASNSRLVRAQGVAMTLYAKALRLASTTAAAFGTSLTAIKSALITTGWGALIVALGYVADKLLLAKTNAEKAADAISKISEETATETAKSVRNFEYLANKAVSAPKGSTEQKEALEELERTYSNILPKELLELEYLDKLNGKYGSLTKTIREYIAEQQRRKGIDEIGNIYGAEKQKYERKLTDYFREQGWTEGEIARFWEKFYDVAKDKSKGLQQVVEESVKFAGREGFEDVFKLLQSQNSATKEFDKARAKDLGKWAMRGSIDYIDMLRDAVLEENQAIEQNEERTKAAQSATNAFADAQEKAAKRLKEVRLVGTEGEAVDRDSYLGGQMLANFEIKDMTNILKDGFARAGLVWDEEYGNFINHINEKTPALISSLNFDAIIDAIIKALDNDQLTDAQRQFLENLLSVAQQSKKRYEEIIPADPIVRVAQTRFKQIAQSAGGFREQYNQYLMKAGEDMKSYNKRLNGSLEDLKNRVKALLDTQKLVAIAGVNAKKLHGVSAEELQKDIDETNKTISIIEKVLSEQSDYSKSRGGTKSDPRLQNLKEEISLTKKLYDEYHKLEKQIGATQAKSKIQEYYANTIADLEKRAKDKYGFTFALPFTDENLKANIRQYISAMETLQKEVDKKGRPKFPTIGKEIDEAKAMLGAIDTDSLSKRIEKQLKELSDRISRTKTAKEFYEKILGMTGDVELAAKVSLSIYGDTGYDLQKQLTERIRTYFDNENVKVEIPVDVITADNQINYKRLGEFAEQMKETLGEEPYKAIKKIAEEGQKDLAKTYEGYLKDLEKAKTYADKRVELARTTAAKIREIESNPQYSKEQKEELKRGYQEREDREAAKLEYEAFKDTPLYVQMFEDLEHASTSTLEMMKSRLESLSRVWGTALDPTQLKEIQSRMNEIDKQLRERNPFKTLKESYRQYRDAVKSVSVEGAAENAAAASTTFYERAKMYGADSAQARAAEKELKAREKILEISKQLVDANGKRLKGQDALNAAARKSFDLETNRRVELEMASAEETALRKESKYDDPNKDPEVIAAHEAVEKAKEEWELAKLVSEILQENAKRSKTLKENIVAAAGESVQFLQAGASVASAIADTMEALGADELDVQYFRDIAEGMGNIAAGVDGLVQSIMAGSISGVISNAIGIIPNMVKGFSQIFNAGKIRKANKEIERQQEILDRLEYTYSRLEKAADSLFGADYISNYNAQMKNLQAQQTAYLRMAEAERSKGKDADDAKIAEYTNAARDAADKIQDMRNELTSKFLGTDRASAAREFAESWLEAKATFASTTDAIQSKYKDMLKSMIVEGAAAKVIDNILAPMWDNMNAMLKKSNIQGAMDYLANNMDGFLQAADSGLNALWATLEARGYDMQKLLGETSDGPTGIAHDIATASEESINGLAAGINTQNFYIAQQLQEVQRIRAIVEAGLQGSSKPSDSSNLLLMQEQAMNHYAAIEANTAATVARLDSVVRMLEGVITPRGTKGARGIQVWT